MQKFAIVKTRFKDPDRYEGEFRIEAEFEFEKEKEFRLSDGRIVVLKSIGNRTKIVTYQSNCQPARDHKILDFKVTYKEPQIAHT